MACLAQFWPVKYPDSYWLLVACVCGYTLLSTLVNGVGVLLEKDTIVLTKARQGRGGMTARSSLPRFSETYTLAVRPRGTPPGSAREATLEKSVGKYFDAEGMLHAEVVEADTAALLERVGGQDAKPKGQ